MKIELTLNIEPPECMESIVRIIVLERSLTTSLAH